MKPSNSTTCGTRFRSMVVASSPTTPQDWETRNTGVTLEVEPVVAGLPILRRCRCDHDGDYLVSDARGTANRWNLRRSVSPRITKFSDHFNDRALAALGS